MLKFPIRSAILSTALACSTLALAATPPPAAESSPAATTQPPGHRPHHRMHHHMRAMNVLRRLDLTDAQRASVRQLIRQNFDRARTETHDLRQKRMAFENATPGSSGYGTAASELARAESDAARARVLRRAELRTKIHDLLTPAQRTQLASIRSQRQAKLKQWRESHMRRAPVGAPATSAAAH